MVSKTSFRLKRFFYSVLLAFFIIATLNNCTSEKQRSKYLRWVGDIENDPKSDELAFKLCNSEMLTKQYFHVGEGIQYDGEMFKIREVFRSKYKSVNINQSGWVRIRFIVNCRGEAGRYRMIESDQNYQSRAFDGRITDQLLTITKSLDGWKQLPDAENSHDYYQYLIFKIKDGDLLEVLP
jgi:hypothetical protein